MPIHLKSRVYLGNRTREHRILLVAIQQPVTPLARQNRTRRVPRLLLRRILHRTQAQAGRFLAAVPFSESPVPANPRQSGNSTRRITTTNGCSCTIPDQIVADCSGAPCRAILRLVEWMLME